MKHVLKEAYSYQKKNNVDFKNIRAVAVDDAAWNVYVESFAQTLREDQQAAFRTLADNTRQVIVENSIANMNPYETLMLPVLRHFFPRLVAKDLVTVRPIDKPDDFVPFLEVTFEKYGGATATAPSIDTDISGGVAVSGEITIPGNIDLLAAAGLTSTVAHLAKNLVIDVVSEDTGSGSGPETVEVNAQPTVDGTFAFDVTFPTSGNKYVITGKADYFNGVVHLSCDPAPASGVTVKVHVTGSISLEENTINSKANFKLTKLRLIVTDRKISGDWSIEVEQDYKALFDIDFQADLSSVIAQQIALDIDREIINTLIKVAETMAGTNHIDEFNVNPPATFTWGQKMWYENILVKLGQLSAEIYNDTQLGGGNTIAANPVDAAIFEALNEFSYTGSSEDGGTVGYQTGTITSKWNVLVSSAVPKGKMLIDYKPNEDMKAIFIHAPYRPVIITPYPLGPKPTITVMSRYANLTARPKGVARLKISRT